MPRRLIFVALPDVVFLNLAGPLEAFQIANEVRAHRGQAPAYDLQVCAPAATVRTSTGVTLQATPLSEATAPHTIMVGGHMGMGERPQSRATRQALAPLAAMSERIVSFCAGTFVLGELGLLDGRRCTTHWLLVDKLAARFPAARVEPDALYVDERPIYTAAGCTAGIDLALYLIAQDLGPKTARAVARLMVVYLHRPGGQSQFSAGLTVHAGSDEALAAVMRQIVANPAGDHRVDVLAQQVAMSPRHFARRFRQHTGKPPATYVRDVRVEAARRALETTDLPPASVAERCGLGSEETLRRVFKQTLGVSPAAYRRRFKAPAGSAGQNV